MRTDIKVIGDVELAAPYIALGKRMVALALQQDKTSFHKRMGNGDEWQLDVLITEQFAKIAVKVEGRLGLYTLQVKRTPESPDHSSSAFPYGDYVIRRQGVHGFRGKKIYDKELQPVSYYFNGHDEYPSLPYGADFDLTYFTPFNFQSRAGKNLFYCALTEGLATENFADHLIYRIHKSPKKAKKSDGGPTEGAMSFEIKNAAYRYVSGSPPGFAYFPIGQGLSVETLDYVDSTTMPPTPRKGIVLGYTQQARPTSDTDLDPQHVYPAWAWSTDGGATWDSAITNIPGYYVGNTFSEAYDEPGGIGIAFRAFNGGQLKPVKENKLVAYICTYEERGVNTEFSSINAEGIVIRVDASFVGTGLVIDYQQGVTGLTDYRAALENISGSASGETKKTLAASELAQAFAEHRIFSLGDGRVLLSMVSVDVPSSSYNYSTEDGFTGNIKHNAMAFISDDYGLTFQPSPSLWGGGTEVYSSYSAEAVASVGRNAISALVLGRGTIWRIEISVESPYLASFKISIDGGDTWAETTAPRGGDITRGQIGNAVLVKACADVAIDNPSRGKGAWLAVNVHDPEKDVWAVYYSKSSGAKWRKGHVWGADTNGGITLAQTYKDLTSAYDPLPYGVIDREE